MYIKNPISYPGNKNRVLNELIPCFPKDAKYFVDVFCGSGVVGVNSESSIIISNDISTHCTDILKYFYENDFETIIEEIEKIINEYKLSYSHRDGKTYIEEKHEGLSRINRTSFNNLKESYNKNPSIPKLIVLSIYGFNHYIRFSKKGFYNVPVGKVDLSSSIYHNLQEFVNHVKSKEILFSNLDFRNDELYKFDDAIYYFDPPYLITTAPYNSYWNIEDETDLLKILDRLNENGKKFCLSNVLLSNGKKNNLLIEWSKKYNVVPIKRQYRNANYQKINLTDSIEVLIKNF